MDFSYQEIRKEVYQIVKKAAYSPRNVFSHTVWDFHIIPIVEHSMILGKKLKADLEILELAALLHDYACFIDRKHYETHHKIGAALAKKFLAKKNYPKEKIERVENCILNHRGSMRNVKKTIEEKILASADAMSHITEPADMFFLAYNVHGYKTLEGARWLKGKINRSWNKIMPEGKKLVKKDYELIMKILNETISRNAS